MSADISSLAVRGKTDLSPQTLSQVRSCVVRHESRHSSSCDLVFSGDNLDSIAAALARKVSVVIEGEVLFEGETVETSMDSVSESGCSLRVRARDSLWRLKREVGTESYSSIDLLGLTSRLVKDVGVKAIMRASRNPKWERLVRYNETPLDFLGRVCHMAGVGFALSGASITLYDAEKGSGSKLSIDGSAKVLRVSIHSDALEDVASLCAYGWDPGKSKELQSSAARAGAEAVRKVAVANAPIADESVLRAFVDGTLAGHTAARKRISATITGVASLAPGALVSYQGPGSPIPTTGIAHRVIHRIAPGSGFITILDTGEAYDATPEEGFALLQARVVDIRDPESRARVRVVYPTLGDLESDWLAVSLPGSGDKKGLLVLPDVGDDVVVGCNMGNIAQGVVIGGLYHTSDHALDAGIGLDRSKKFRIDTRNGNSLILSDDPDSIQIKTVKGCVISLDDSGVRIDSGKGTQIRIDDGKAQIVCPEFEVSAGKVTIAAGSIDLVNK